MTNSYYILNKNNLTGFLKAAMKDYPLIAPQQAKGEDFLFQPVSDPAKIRLDYDITSNSLKEFFFPAREEIFKFENKVGSSSIKIIPLQDKNKRGTIFFGLRSCDSRAVNFQDNFFSRKPQDALYGEKRQKAILISFACNRRPRKSCFCALTKSGPFLDKGEGFDLQFMDVGAKFLVETGTEKGAELINKYWKFFKPAGVNDIKKKPLLKNKCLKEFSRKYNFTAVYNKLKKYNLDKLWDDLGRRCTNCGGCEFICPTCFCFYTQDKQVLPGLGARIRAWDSCVFSGYSLMAGGANPHEKNSSRISRRFYCKLFNSYNWFKITACTGCGRCSFACPVNLDMESFIASLGKAGGYKPLLKEL